MSWENDNFQSKVISDTKRKELQIRVENNSKHFIVPFRMKTGFSLITNQGPQSPNNLVESYTQAKYAFTGKAGIIAQWLKSTHIDAKKVPSSFNVNNIDNFSDDDIKKSLAKDISFYQDSGENKPQYTWDGTNFLDLEGIGFGLKAVIDRIKIGYGNIFVIDLNLIGSLLEQHYTKRYEELGTVWKGWLTKQDTTGSFGNSPASQALGNFVEWSLIRNYTIETTHEFSQSELFYLYVIPIRSSIYDTVDTKTSTNEVELMFISNIEVHRSENGAYCYSTVVFSSLNDHLTTTGQTIQSFVQFGAPGEGYAFPKVEFDDKGIPIGITMDEDRKRDIGVDSIQLEFLGPVGFTAPIIQGRPIEKLNEVNENVYPSRDLLVRDILYPVVDNLNQQSAPTTSFYLTNATPNMITSYKDWREARQSQWTDDLKKNYEGVYQTDPTPTKATNTDGKAICDTNFNFKGQKILDRDLSTTSSYAFMYENSDSKKIGYEKINIGKHPRSKPQDIMNLARFIFQSMPIIPMSVTEVIAWNLTQLPAIGNLLNKLLLGVPVGWRQVRDYTNTTFPKITGGIPMFLSSELYNYSNDAFWGGDSAGKGRLPLDIFRQGTEDEVGGIINSSSMSTAFMFRLTDKCTLMKWDKTTGKELGLTNTSTIMLGQENYIQKKPNEVFTLNVATQDLDPTLNTSGYLTDIIGSPSYIIDKIGFEANGKCDVKITCFSSNPDTSLNPSNDVIWQTTLQTTSKFVNQTRQHITIYQTSYIDDFIDDDAVFEFPKPLPQPQPSINFENINESLSKANEVMSVPTGPTPPPNFNPPNNECEQKYTYGTTVKLDKTTEVLDFGITGLTNWNDVLNVYSRFTIKYGDGSSANYQITDLNGDISLKVSSSSTLTNFKATLKRNGMKLSIKTEGSGTPMSYTNCCNEGAGYPSFCTSYRSSPSTASTNLDSIIIYKR